MVYVVEDDEIVRNTLAALLSANGIEVCALADGEELLAQTEIRRPACLLIDLRLPRKSGLDVQAELRTRGVSLPVIFLSGFADVPSTVRAMKAGAIDFLEKPYQTPRLLQAIRDALQLDEQRSASAAREQTLRRRAALLTHREREVVDRVVRGMTNRAIGLEFGISEKTVKVHRGRAMTKMGAESLADLVRMTETVSLSVDEPAHAAASTPADESRYEDR